MSVITTAVTVSAAGAAYGGKMAMGPALWMLIMVVAMVAWVGYLNSENAKNSESALKDSTKVVIAFGFVSMIAIMIFVP